MLTFLVLVLITLPTLTLVHEGGHLLAARALGAKARMKWATLGPETEAVFPRPSRFKEAAFYLAGPLANVVAGVGAGLLLGRMGGPIALLHLSFGLGQLLPRKGSDGTEAARLLRGG